MTDHEREVTAWALNKLRKAHFANESGNILATMNIIADVQEALFKLYAGIGKEEPPCTTEPAPNAEPA